MDRKNASWTLKNLLSYKIIFCKHPASLMDLWVGLTCQSFNVHYEFPFDCVSWHGGGGAYELSCSQMFFVL